MIFDRKEDIAIKEIFKAFKNWSYTSSCSDGKVYWEVNFKKVDSAIDLEKLRQRVYDLPFEPAANIGRGSVATFYGLYNIETLRKELELAEFAA
jgi:hypothetical protein